MVMWAFFYLEKSNLVPYKKTSKNKKPKTNKKLPKPLDSEDKTQYILFSNFQFILVNMHDFWEYSRRFDKLCVWQKIDKEEYLTAYITIF